MHMSQILAWSMQSDETNQLPIHSDVSMNDHLSRLINAWSKAAPEDESIQSSFEFHEHQTSKRSLSSQRTSLLLLLHRHLCAVTSAAVFISQVLLFCSLACVGFVGSDVWKSTREEPTLEDFLGDMVTVITSY